MHVWRVEDRLIGEAAQRGYATHALKVNRKIRRPIDPHHEAVRHLEMDPPTSIAIHEKILRCRFGTAITSRGVDEVERP